LIDQVGFRERAATRDVASDADPIYRFWVFGPRAPVWLPELFPTRMRGTAVAFAFNAPRFISCTVGLGGYGGAATIVGLFFILGVLAAPFLPETRGQPLPETLGPAGVTAAVATAAG
jgi:hypothetical protein